MVGIVALQQNSYSTAVAVLTAAVIHKGSSTEVVIAVVAAVTYEATA